METATVGGRKVYQWNLGLGEYEHWGTWYVSQSSPASGKMYRFKPSIHMICEPLLRSPDDLALAKRFAIYEECLDLIEAFKVVYPLDYKTDILTLAIYRRCITTLSCILHDDRLFNFATEAKFTTADWDNFAQRMPEYLKISADIKLHREFSNS